GGPIACAGCGLARSAPCAARLHNPRNSSAGTRRGDFVAQPHLTHGPAEERLPATHTVRPDSDATRRAILAASANWFSRIGFERTTTRQIATSANVNQGLLYYYF